MRDLFYNKILVYSKKSLDKFNVGFVQDGLVDMILLSKSKKILASWGSTFSEGAWWMNACEVEVDVIINNKSLERYLKRKSIQSKKIFLNIKKIIYELITPLNKRLLS